MYQYPRRGVALLCQESFTGAKTWVKELMRRGDPNVVIVLTGNKADLASRREVSREVRPSTLLLPVSTSPTRAHRVLS